MSSTSEELTKLSVSTPLANVKQQLTKFSYVHLLANEKDRKFLQWFASNGWGHVRLLYLLSKEQVELLCMLARNLRYKLGRLPTDKGLYNLEKLRLILQNKKYLINNFLYLSNALLLNEKTFEKMSMPGVYDLCFWEIIKVEHLPRISRKILRKLNNEHIVTLLTRKIITFKTLCETSEAQLSKLNSEAVTKLLLTKRITVAQVFSTSKQELAKLYLPRICDYMTREVVVALADVDAAEIAEPAYTFYMLEPYQVFAYSIDELIKLGYPEIYNYVIAGLLRIEDVFGISASNLTKLGTPEVFACVKSRALTISEVFELSADKLSKINNANICFCISHNMLTIQAALALDASAISKLSIPGITKYLYAGMLSIEEVCELTPSQLNKFTIPGIYQCLTTGKLKKTDVFALDTENLAKFGLPKVFECLDSGRLDVSQVLATSKRNLAKLGISKLHHCGIYSYIESNILTPNEVFESSESNLYKLLLPGVFSYVTRGALQIAMLFEQSVENLNKLSVPGAFDLVVDRHIDIADVFNASKSNLEKLGIPGVARIIKSGKVSLAKLFTLSTKQLLKLKDTSVCECVINHPYAVDEILSIDLDILERLDLARVDKLAVERGVKITDFFAQGLKKLSFAYRKSMSSSSVLIDASERELLAMSDAKQEFISFVVNNTKKSSITREYPIGYSVRTLSTAFDYYLSGNEDELAWYMLGHPKVLKRLIKLYGFYKKLDEIARKSRTYFNSGVHRLELGILLYEFLSKEDPNADLLLSALLKHPLSYEFAVAIASQPKILELISTIGLKKHVIPTYLLWIKREIASVEPTVDRLNTMLVDNASGRLRFYVLATRLKLLTRLTPSLELPATALHTIPGLRIPQLQRPIVLDSDLGERVTAEFRQISQEKKQRLGFLKYV